MPGGLQQLFGPLAATAPPRVRDFVFERALAALADGFGAEAVFFVRRDEAMAMPTVSSRTPTGWADSAGLTFELFGRLWRLLDTGREAEEVIDLDGHREVGRYRVWLGCHTTESSALAVAVVRREPFDPADRLALDRLLGSVARAVAQLAGPATDGPRPDVRTGVDGGRDGELAFWAEVALDGGAGGRSARADGSSEEMAVARATAAAAATGAEVSFAGRGEVEGVTVSIVVLAGPGPSPRIGLSVLEEAEARRGPADAVLAALVEPS